MLIGRSVVCAEETNSARTTQMLEQKASSLHAQAGNVTRITLRDTGGAG
jgi:hypothetical protein